MPAKPPAIDALSVESKFGSVYPPEFAGICERRAKRALGNALGLSQFGVNLVHVPPGQATAQRHWHTLEDEFIYVLEGQLVLVTDAGEQTLSPGMAAGFPAGKEDGHMLVNRSGTGAVYLEAGSRNPEDDVDYSDIDMVRRHDETGRRFFVRKDGTAY